VELHNITRVNRAVVDVHEKIFVNVLGSASLAAPSRDYGGNVPRSMLVGGTAFLIG
jgi:hypothetical protein